MQSMCSPVEWQLSGPFRAPTHFATPDVQPGHVSATQVFSVEGSQHQAMVVFPEMLLT